MHEVTRIVDQLKRAYDGDAWHGPSVRGVLEGVDAQMASARPYPPLIRSASLVPAYDIVDTRGCASIAGLKASHHQN